MRVPQEQDGQTPVQFVFIEHPLCTSGIGLEGRECKQPQRPICLSSPSTLLIPPMAGTAFLYSDQPVCFRGPPSLPPWRFWLCAPFLVVWLPMTPKGLLAKFCSLDFVCTPSALPSQHLLAPAPAPAPVCPCKHKSAVCADKAMRRSGGRACRRDISRELWGQWLGGQRPLSDSRDLASPSRGLG